LCETLLVVSRISVSEHLEVSEKSYSPPIVETTL